MREGREAGREGEEWEGVRERVYKSSTHFILSLEVKGGVADAQ